MNGVFIHPCPVCWSQNMDYQLHPTVLHWCNYLCIIKKSSTLPWQPPTGYITCIMFSYDTSIGYLLDNKITTTATALIPMMVQLISVCKRGLHRQQDSWVQHGAHLGLVGPIWVPWTLLSGYGFFIMLLLHLALFRRTVNIVSVRRNRGVSWKISFLPSNL